MIVPDNYIDKIRVSYDEASRNMSVLNNDGTKLVFSIMPVLKATYNEDDYKGYTKILDDSGYCYLAKIGDGSEMNITIENLKSYIKSV